jgi:hypothetical protein
MAKNKRLKIDMCAGSELKDTQGETLSIEGADISDLQNGNGRLNDNHGKGFFNSIGRVTSAKKIFKAEDCDNERHRYYWEKIKAPYIYVAGELYNDEDHPNARAAAAIMKNVHREDIPLKMKASVEGGVMARGISDPSRLAQTKIHSVALTFTPANNATLVEPLNLDKSNADWEGDMRLIKSVMHLAETNIPSFRHIERHASANAIFDNIAKIKELAKTIGVDITVSESSPEAIMKQAAAHKVEQNIKKINDLVKAIGPNGLAIKPVPNQTRDNVRAKEKEIKQTRLDAYQQNIGQAKTAATSGPRVNQIPNQPVAKPNAASEPIKNAQEVKQNNMLQIHANKALGNIGHLDNVHSDLVSRGIDPAKATQVIDKIKSYMKVEKAEQYSKAKHNLLKAMTAGYGGGTPTSATGGQVIQSESLEDGRSKSEDKMKYIVCDDCGNEQVYMKHQVKCRKCNHNLSLNKLENLI